MNVTTPALPRPLDLPVAQRRAVVSVVEAVDVAREVEDEPRRRPGAAAPATSDVGGRERLAGAPVATRATAHPGYVNRALDAYGRVAAEGDRNALRDLLGFDAYA